MTYVSPVLFVFNVCIPCFVLFLNFPYIAIPLQYPNIHTLHLSTHIPKDFQLIPLFERHGLVYCCADDLQECLLAAHVPRIASPSLSSGFPKIV
jgi:hypothetical protein